ncbi:collectin-12-like [Anthonomus grandis grandis]|uniref:collectin-12-like n=1 Tax=Anthonomus grandis grandis TaxID=2921223 RepID=UPI0021656C29|nr:collectin-12-like [Anthonomus grandis grandis]
MLRALVLLAILGLYTNALEESGLTQLGKKFLISGYKTTFLDAFVTCKALGYQLASILNETDEAELNNTVPIGKDYWLGAVYEQTQVFESKWVWIHSLEPAEYANWNSGEPSPGSTAFCVGRVYTGYWVSLPCNAQNLFLCQKIN